MGLKDLHEAREALWENLRRFGDDELDELEGVSLTLRELGLTSTEAVEQADPKAFLYLGRKLAEAVKAVTAWHESTWALAVIVSEGDINALDRYPHLLPQPVEA